MIYAKIHWNLQVILKKWKTTAQPSICPKTIRKLAIHLNEESEMFEAFQRFPSIILELNGIVLEGFSVAKIDDIHRFQVPVDLRFKRSECLLVEGWEGVGHPLHPKEI